MRKNPLYLLTLILCVACAKTETANDIEVNPLLQEFNELVTVEKEEFLGKTFASWRLDTALARKSKFEWLNENTVMVNYYLRNALEIDSSLMSNEIIPYARKEQEVRRAILSNTTLGSWLESSQSNENKMQEEGPKWMIPGDSLMDIASKFFYMSDWNPHLVQMSFRFCEGINGQERNAPKEQKLVAAFCFQTLRNNMESTQRATSDFYYESSMRPFRKLAEDYPDSVDAAVMKDQLLTLRQELYDHVSSDSSFQDIIFRTYEEQKEILPFALTQ